MELKNQKNGWKSLRTGIILLAGVCLLAMLGVVPVNAQQQSKTVTGTVVDKQGTPLAGVTVSLQGTSVVTLTDVNGQYAIPVQSDNQTLRFSYIGYKPVTAGTAQSVIRITLEEDALLMDEVVITAMGIKKERKALGYAVQELKADEIMKNKTANLLNSMSGKIAGVNVTQTSGGAGAGANIILRGGTSLERDNQPLFVVDGIIYDNSTSINGNSLFDGAQSTNSTYSNRVMDINPDDIESMSVLKGPAAAALYGSRAAAGVIVITTKKGEEGTVKVNVSSKFQTNWANRLPEQQSKYKRGAYAQNGDLLEGDATTTMGSWGAPFGTGEKKYDNLGNFFEQANTWDNTVSLSGGTKNGSFYFSASNYSQTGIIPNSSYDKTTFRFNGEQKYGILKVGANVAYSIADQLSSLTSGGLYGSNGEGAVQAAYLWPRDLDMKHWLNEDGTKYRLFDWELVQNDYDNPYWILNKMPRTDKTKRLTANINIDLNITDWWSVNYVLGTDRYTTNTNRFSEPGSGISLVYQKGLLTENERTYEYLSSNFMTSFHKQFGDFDFNLLLGTAMEDRLINYNGRKAWNFIIPEFYVVTNVANTDLAISQSKNQKRLVGVYGEFRASYKNWAYLTVTGRNDWTSTLPIKDRSYFYPSVSGSFVFTELLPKNDILSFGKIRASWARVGKDADAYVTNTYVNPPEFTTYDNGNGMGIRDEWTRGNPYLVPEITQSQEYGFELQFLGGRIGLDYAYYQNKSINQLLQPRMSQTTGYILLMTNAGEITNNGMEVTLNTVPVQTKDFTWELSVNASGNRGKVNDLLQGLEILYVTDVQVGNAKAASFNGGNFMAISGSKWLKSPDGYLVLNKDSGMPTSDGLTTHEIGNREPKLFGGINNSLQYKNWNLSFLLDYRIGGDVYNGTEHYLTDNGMSTRSANRESLSITGVVDTGTKDADGNPVYTAPQTFTYEAGKMYTVGSQQMKGEYIIQNYYWQGAYALESANYMTNTNWLRLRSVSLSYSLPESVLRKLKVVKNLTATVTGTNLLLWTNYKGMDPETSAAGSGAVGSSSVGIDYCGIPALAGVSFGLNLTF
ncbi:MAG: SusC/RagA family TonB-linked outer membrane protein [Prevotellaceae bacterium]|jgi:TonB-linked SusC/RagA family outer membrane protein|nr:SusC/RagA family TonB-linked outer membrane protein [Prevotellaceae bacterium]